LVKRRGGENLKEKGVAKSGTWKLLEDLKKKNEPGKEGSYVTQ